MGIQERKGLQHNNKCRETKDNTGNRKPRSNMEELKILFLLVVNIVSKKGIVEVFYTCLHTASCSQTCYLPSKHKKHKEIAFFLHT